MNKLFFISSLLVAILTALFAHQWQINGGQELVIFIMGGISYYLYEKVEE